MKASHRLFLNTTVTYTRSLIGAGMALFSSRWVLTSLGQVDYGLFSLVGSILIFISFLNSVLATSSSRHFAYAIGQGASGEVSQWFNVAFSVHFFLSIFLTLLGWIIGEHLISHVLTIPEERIVICQQVFRISLVSMFTGMVSVPYVAMFRAKQNIVELSFWSLLQSFLNFVLSACLLIYQGEHIIFYAYGIVLVQLIFHCGQILRATILFEECSIVFRLFFNRKKVIDIFYFAAWNLVGNFGMTLRDQGSNILLNIFFGAKVNAAFGIARQVSSQVDQLASSMLGAFAPEITTREGRGDRPGMVRLSLQVCKFGTLLILVFLVPLIIEMDFVLNLWLVNPPPYTSIFCRLILIMFFIDRLSTGYMLAINSCGKIAGYQATAGATLILNLPLSWVLLHLGFKPSAIGYVFIFTMLLFSLGRALWGYYLLEIKIGCWLARAVYPSMIVFLFSFVFAILPVFLLSSSFIRFFIVVLISLFSFFISSWMFAISKTEKEFFLNLINKILKKLIDFLLINKKTLFK